jgi:predicted lipoprotein with Yx(FWY)xxD motif
MDMRKMTSLVSTVGLALALAGQARADGVKVATSEKAGSYLTDAQGKALYTFKKDSAGRSACAGDCLARWPVYLRESGAVSGALKDSDFGIITREDGRKQSTYKGMPLYYFANDQHPGETNGDGVKDVWFLAKP